MIKFSCVMVASIMLLVLAAVDSELVTASDAPKLFSIVTEAKQVSDENRSSAASVREAEIAFALDAGTLANQSAIIVPLFDGEMNEAKVARTERRSSTDVTWVGRVKFGPVDGEVIITHKNGFVSGLVYGAKAVYEIVPRGEKHMLVELDQSRFPECGGGVSETGRNASPSQAAIAGVDSGDRIDVMVVYTTATKNFLGGDAQAQALAQAAIDSTNTAYINSQIRQRVRLVHSQEFVYTETSASTDLSNLRNNATIQALRDTHKADLVSEISEVTGVCGIGYLMGAPGGNQNNAFTVTVRSCAVGNLSFAHELGHNMGSHHNPENGSNPTYPYGFGHYVNGNYRTVMSYVDPCPAGCTRRPYFSNPSVIFNGFPTGIENARDNARSINNTADWIAGYRYSGSSLTLTSFSGGEWLPRLITRNVTWTSDALTGDVKIEISRDLGDTWETLVASTPNDGSQAINVGGRATRRARIRVSSVANPAVSDSSVTNVSIR